MFWYWNDWKLNFSKKYDLFLSILSPNTTPSLSVRTVHFIPVILRAIPVIIVVTAAVGHGLVWMSARLLVAWVIHLTPPIVHIKRVVSATLNSVSLLTHVHVRKISSRRSAAALHIALIVIQVVFILWMILRIVGQRGSATLHLFGLVVVSIVRQHAQIVLLCLCHLGKFLP